MAPWLASNRPSSRGVDLSRPINSSTKVLKASSVTGPFGSAAATRVGYSSNPKRRAPSMYPLTSSLLLAHSNNTWSKGSVFRRLKSASLVFDGLKELDSWLIPPMAIRGRADSAESAGAKNKKGVSIKTTSVLMFDLESRGTTSQWKLSVLEWISNALLTLQSGSPLVGLPQSLLRQAATCKALHSNLGDTHPAGIRCWVRLLEAS